MKRSMGTLFVLVTISFYSQDVLACPLCTADRDGEPKAYPHWVGEWQVSSNLNKALGFDGDRVEHSAYPTSFQLTFDRAIGEKVKHYRDIFTRMGHEITVTGKWETRGVFYADDSPQENRYNDCVVTTNGNSTFLWLVHVPFIEIYGGKVSFIEGDDRDHDVMFIDFNTMPKHLSGKVRARETVAYQRAPKDEAPSDDETAIERTERDRSTDKPQPDHRWVGSWEVAERFNRLLGFDDENSRFEAVVSHPTSFKISLDKKMGERMHADRLRAYRAHFQGPRLGHRLIGTGKWETTFGDDDPRLGTDCFVTEYRGSRFLFTPARFVAAYGGKVSFIEGIDRDHDVIVIDFNWFSHHRVHKDRTPDTVVYRRATKNGR